MTAAFIWCSALVAVVATTWRRAPGVTRECTRCGGSGRVRMPMTVHRTRCPNCGGRGRRPRNEGAWE